MQFHLLRCCTLGIRIKMASRRLLLQNTVVLRLNWSRILRWVFQIKLPNFSKWTPLERWVRLVLINSVTSTLNMSGLIWKNLLYVICRFLSWRHLMVLSSRAMPLRAMVRTSSEFLILHMKIVSSSMIKLYLLAAVTHLKADNPLFGSSLIDYVSDLRLSCISMNCYLVLMSTKIFRIHWLQGKDSGYSIDLWLLFKKRKTKKVLQTHEINCCMNVPKLFGLFFWSRYVEKSYGWGVLVVMTLIVSFSTYGFHRPTWSSGLILQRWRLTPIFCVGLYPELAFLFTCLRLAFHHLWFYYTFIVSYASFWLWFLPCLCYF